MNSDVFMDVSGCWKGLGRGCESAGASHPCFLGAGNQIDAAKELGKTGAGDLVVDIQTPLLRDKQAGTLHHRQVLGESGDIASRHFRELTHAVFPVHQALHDQEA